MLLGIKESYLLCRNLLGLTNHPFKTIREIVEDQDYSQAALVFGLPFNLLMFGSLTLFAARILSGKSGSLGWLAQLLLFLLGLLSLLVFMYLVYWGWQVWKWRRQNEKSIS
ncbi:hypothetical protein KKD62_02950 [Patescibacteria group bacterium]|nr:hypothetical protein [Patescibacteria group bacterium]